MIKELKVGTMLYHGSFCEVREPDINKCRKYKDFGQGFYLTTDLEQAKRFAVISLKKAIESGTVAEDFQDNAVSCFEYMPDETLDIKLFHSADVEWLHCIAAHRIKNGYPDIIEQLKSKDIIGGKIANDNTNRTIYAYLLGTFGTPGTQTADNICISLLLPERLKDQYCFRTSKALSCLAFKGCLRP